MLTNNSFSSARQQPTFRKLSDEKTERIHNASLEILERTGLRMYESQAIELLKKKGVNVDDDGHVRIPRNLVEWALSVAPKSATLYNRHGKPVMALEGYNTYFGTGSDCPNVIDLHSGEHRPGRLQDVVDASIVCDALLNIDFLM